MLSQAQALNTYMQARMYVEGQVALRRSGRNPPGRAPAAKGATTTSGNGSAGNKPVAMEMSLQQDGTWGTEQEDTVNAETEGSSP